MMWAEIQMMRLLGKATILFLLHLEEDIALRPYGYIVLYLR